MIAQQRFFFKQNHTLKFFLQMRFLLQIWIEIMTQDVFTWEPKY